MSKKKLSLVFIAGLILGIFVINSTFRFLGIPTFDEVLTFIFG